MARDWITFCPGVVELFAAARQELARFFSAVVHAAALSRNLEAILVVARCLLMVPPLL